MIINTGQRTDIPAFYPEWFANRLRAGYVCVRNPYNPRQVSRYRLDPRVVDVIGFCTKNPKPFFPYLPLLEPYGQYWFVTITPYGKDIEPCVPPAEQVMESFKFLSLRTGIHSIGWRYDPILLTQKYTKEWHIHTFDSMAGVLEGYTETVVISFVDLYHKVRRNFPQLKEVSWEDRVDMGKAMAEIARRHNMRIKTCAEGKLLAPYGVDCTGCLTVDVYEKAIGQPLTVPQGKPSRAFCSCYLSCDIGAYDTCGHLCRYCYANNDVRMVQRHRMDHDKHSPFLIGGYRDGDIIHQVPQQSWIRREQNLFEI